MEEEKLPECSADELIDLLKKLGETTINAEEILKQHAPVVLPKEEFIKKISACPNFRAQLFLEPRFFGVAKPMLNMDALYSEYADMKQQKIGALSQFVRDNILYVSERIGDRVRVMFREYDYDIIGDHNFPTSDPEDVLPIDDEEIQYWNVNCRSGHFIFEKSDQKVGDFLTIVRLFSIKKDVFLFCGEIIVHVQDFDTTYEGKEEELIPKFMDYLESIGGSDIEKILDRIIKEEPQLINKDD